MTWNLQIEGMTCGGCGASVERILRSILPDAEVTVQWSVGAAQVRALAIDEGVLADRLAAAGFVLTALTARP
ncbi:MAG: Heavy-metal-associated domain [Pseudomonadota bacterium]|jgi:copper chaperone CopZ